MGKDHAAGSNTGGGRPAGDNAVVSAGGTSRGSRVAFALALTALMLGTFVSFGGLTYAATQTKNAAHTVKNVASGRKFVVHHSSAADQYQKSKPGEKQTFTPPSGPSAAGSPPGSSGPIEAQGTLPFTGLSLAGTALASGLLLLVGIVLRRRKRRFP